MEINYSKMEINKLQTPDFVIIKQNTKLNSAGVIHFFKGHRTTLVFGLRAWGRGR